MSIVVDASVLVAALVDAGSHGAWAEDILTGDTPCSPELVYVEVANVLRRLERTKAITETEANAAYEDLMQLRLELFSFEPFAQRAWELRHSITSYDAWYVAVAEALDSPLATLDERLARAKGPACEFVTFRR